MGRFVALLFIIVVMPAFGNLPTVGYVYDYYYQQCGNPDLDIPGRGETSLAAQQYLLQIVDGFNEGATTYAADTPTDNIISIGYLIDSLDMLKESTKCCVGGYHDIGTNECWSCGDWRMDTTSLCFGLGEYYHNGACVSCGAGYICSAGVSYRTPCGAGYYCENNTRHKCTHGRGQCPESFHTSMPKDVACDFTSVFAATASDACWDAGVYFDGATCATCPGGYVCPSGTPNKIECGAGYWCANNVRTKCEYGRGQCPGTTHATAPTADDLIACDDAWIFVGVGAENVYVPTPPVIE